MSTITLNDVTAQKFHAKIRNAAATAGAAMQKLENDNRSSRDFITRLGNNAPLHFAVRTGRLGRRRRRPRPRQ